MELSIKKRIPHRGLKLLNLSLPRQADRNFLSDRIGYQYTLSQGFYTSVLFNCIFSFLINLRSVYLEGKNNTLLSLTWRPEYETTGRSKTHFTIF